MEITYEMQGWYWERTGRHRGLVKENLKALSAHELLSKEALVERGNSHDLDKYSVDNNKAYILVSWYFKKRRECLNFQMPKHVLKAVNKATHSHVISNAHHPEYHANKIKPISIFERDDIVKGNLSIIEVPEMPIHDVAEMVCDWTAIAQELGEENASARSWADKQIGNKWVFFDKDTQLIYDFITVLECRD